MAIERLSFPSDLNMQAGIEIDMDNMNTHISRAMKRFGGNAHSLREGVYDVTPPIWRKNAYKYSLTVLDSGIGVMRMLPTDKDVESRVIEDGIETNAKKGGRVIRIPEDQPMAVVMGPNRLNHHMCLYEVIYFIPGPNPRVVFSKN